ncbi:hypothetical protein [Streptomyces sp. NPDC053427]|uniref:hypothetical protein n=1 Tax=Streptomyces sp. NPDC053427 TaxID=3365701 RepID=UPI0037D29CE1
MGHRRPGTGGRSGSTNGPFSWGSCSSVGLNAETVAAREAFTDPEGETGQRFLRKVQKTVATQRDPSARRRRS